MAVSCSAWLHPLQYLVYARNNQAWRTQQDAASPLFSKPVGVAPPGALSRLLQPCSLVDHPCRASIGSTWQISLQSDMEEEGTVVYFKVKKMYN